MDVKLVDLAGIEERGDQFSAAHHPDVFSRRRAQRRAVVGELRVERPTFPTPFAAL